MQYLVQRRLCELAHVRLVKRCILRQIEQLQLRQLAHLGRQLADIAVDLRSTRTCGTGDPILQLRKSDIAKESHCLPCSRPYHTNMHATGQRHRPPRCKLITCWGNARVMHKLYRTALSETHEVQADQVPQRCSSSAQVLQRSAVDLVQAVECQVAQAPQRHQAQPEERGAAAGAGRRLGS